VICVQSSPSIVSGSSSLLSTSSYQVVQFVEQRQSLRLVLASIGTTRPDLIVKTWCFNLCFAAARQLLKGCLQFASISVDELSPGEVVEAVQNVVPSSRRAVCRTSKIDRAEVG